MSELLEDDDEKRLLRGIVRRLPEKEQRLMVQRFGLFGARVHTQKQLADQMAFPSPIFLGWKSVFYQRSARKCSVNVPNRS